MSSDDITFLSGEIRLSVNNLGTTWEELAPLLDSVARKSGQLTAHRRNPQSPGMGGGFIDVGIAIQVIAVAGGIAFIKRFAELLAEDVHSIPRHLLAIRRKYLADKGLEKAGGPVAATALQLGSFVFYFTEDMTEAEFGKRMRRCIELLNARSEDVLSELPHADAPYGRVWDSERRTWTPLDWEVREP